MLNILFIFAILSFFATGSHKISPETYHLAKHESRQGTWTRGKGVFFTKVGEVGSAKYNMKNEALVKIQIFWVGLEIQLSQPDVSCCLFTVCFFLTWYHLQKWVQHNPEVSNLGQVAKIPMAA